MESLLDYLDILEDLLDNSKTMPFSNKISVDKERIFDIIKDIRLNLPNEIRQAQRVIEEHDRYVSEAKREAANIIKEAEVSARQMTSSHEIYKSATEQAAEVIDETNKKARDMRLNAMDYADEILAKTEQIIHAVQDNLREQHESMALHLSETIEILYANRQELRGGKN
jgi:vacuolar-type H+-ATPase subunit H